MENRFKQLRYKDQFLLHQEISMTKLAEEMGISKATISNLESSNDYDAKISIIKKYKERFPDVSYDYLLGATNTKWKQYNRLEEELPFGNEFYESLKKLTDLQDKDSTLCVKYMLEAFLHNPEVFSSLLLEIFSCLAEIYSLQNGPDDVENFGFEPPKYAISNQYARINHLFTEFLDNHITPLLAPQFQESLNGYTNFIDTLREFGGISLDEILRIKNSEKPKLNIPKEELPF